MNSMVVVPVAWGESQPRVQEAWVGSYRLTVRSPGIREEPDPGVDWYVDLIWVDPYGSLESVARGTADTVADGKDATIHALSAALLAGRRFKARP